MNFAFLMRVTWRHGPSPNITSVELPFATIVAGSVDKNEFYGAVEPSYISCQDLKSRVKPVPPPCSQLLIEIYMI